uniref:Uncharacterized protein n=1 Tax=Avena sativa TaxID=4498 RepID=A0ACD5V8P7_AVESA
MRHEGGDETDGSCRLSAAEAAPLDSSNLLGEILLRLPPQPSSLLRVSFVSKLWGSLVSSAAFHRRLCAHHRDPPILGVYGKSCGDIGFTSVLDPPDRIPAERFALPVSNDDFFDSWSLLGCRHGRVLAFNRVRLELLVFHPVSGDRRTVSLPPGFDLAGYGHGFSTNGAVLCTAGDDDPGHVHGNCQSSPFKVVLVGTFHGNQRPAIARVYSSETGLWGDLVSTQGPFGGFFGLHPGTLIGNSLYWWLHGFDIDILVFNLDSQRLAVIKRLPVRGADIHRCNMRIIRAEDGDVGIAVSMYPSLHMWDHKVSRHGSATWVLRKTVNLRNIIGIPSSINRPVVAIVAYAEDADEIFISVRGAGDHRHRGSLIILQLKSMKVREYRGSFLDDSYHPFTDFFTAGTVRARSTPVIEPHQPSSH